MRGAIHTNTIEGVWALLKRGLLGIYHFTSTQHLQKYLDEFAFRHNSKDFTEQDRFNYFFKNMKHRIKYKDLIQHCWSGYSRNIA